MTGIIADSMYEFFVENDALSKGCRRKSRRTKDQLLIDKMVLADCKRKHKNVAMAWVEYKKAYDVVPHSLIIESLKMAQVAESPLCRRCGSKGETVAYVVSVSPVSWRRQNIKEAMITWHGISIWNFVVNVDWKELTAGMNRSRREWWKVKISRYCGISQSGVIEKLRQEDQTLPLLTRRRERLP